jgi:hypothetical protein
MSRFHLTLVVTAIICAASVRTQAAASTPGLDAPRWTIFSDDAGTTVDYPAGIFSVDVGPARRGKGRELRSVNERARLMVYVEDNDEGYTPANFIRAQLKVPRSELDYNRVTNRFFAISGVNDDQIYYSRCNFPLGAAGRIHCVYVAYPEEEKGLWDPIVTRISLNLRPFY